MNSFFSRAFDTWRGRGAQAVTVPAMDGALHPNQRIEEAPVLIEALAPDNLVQAGGRALFSTGAEVHLLRTDGAPSARCFARIDRPVSALAAHPSGAVAIGLAGRIELRGGARDGKRFTEIGGRALTCPVALAFADETTLIVALGSEQNPPERWKHDLMERNASGSVWRLDLDSAEAVCLADRLAWPCGLLPDADGSVLVSESWRNQLLRVRQGARAQAALTDIPGYPAGLSPAGDGDGTWLAVFAPRSQLVEFVLRERAYREQMMREVDPALWIAPALSSGLSSREPMQVGGLMQLGIRKPWAPSRSYGLVIRLDSRAEPQFSFHSRADGRRHGVTSAVETGGRLLAASNGGDVIVAISLSAAE